jgi:Rrf2 family protein
MKFTSRFHYGIKTLVDISIYDHGNGVLQKEIASRNSLSVRFLDQVIAALKTSQLIYKMRGYRAGYRLNREPNSINLYEVYRSLEGELDVYTCVNQEQPCPNASTCATHMTLEDFNQEVVSLLRNRTIAEVVNRQNMFN